MEHDPPPLFARRCTPSSFRDSNATILRTACANAMIVPQTEESVNRVLLLLAAIFAALGLLQCSQHPADQPDGTEGRVSKANQPWPLKEYPKMIARLGRETFERATLRIPAIAQKASKNPDCDRVTYVGIGDSS